MIKDKILPILLLLFFLMFQIPEIKEFMIWKRDSMELGHYWTLFSSSFTHVNLIHLIMNSIVLFLIYFFFNVKNKEFITITIISLLFIGISLTALDYKTYAGFSGVIYSLISYYLLIEIYSKNKYAILLFILFFVKVILDFNPEIKLTSALIDALIAKEIHLSGFLSGIFTFFVLRIKNKKSLCI